MTYSVLPQLVSAVPFNSTIEIIGCGASFSAVRLSIATSQDVVPEVVVDTISVLK